MFKSWLIFLIPVAALLFGAFIVLNSRGVIEKNTFFALETFSSPSPSPFLFEELTIPFLRSRKYKSTLGQLQKYSENGNYTSYLTSYNSDGFKINGLLTEPKGQRPAEGWPAIVFIHGYIPPVQYQTTQRYTAYVDFLAGNGFAVFKIDLRGNGDSEGEPGGAYYSSDYVIDALNAYSALESAGFIDKNKIGLWGHSMAGNVVMRAFAVKPAIPAVVIWAGAGYTYKDLADFRLRDASYMPQPSDSERQKKRQKLREVYGEPKDGNPFWDSIAPSSYLKDLKGAIQLNHSVDDNVVSVEYSRNLNKLLDETSVPHELHEYQGGGHNINDPYFTDAMKNTVDFFNTYLKK